MATLVNNNFVNTELISNLQQALIRREDTLQEQQHPNRTQEEAIKASTKPGVLVTNGEGMESPGLTFLVEALLQDAVLDVHVYAPQLDRSVCGHSVTTRETLAGCSAEVGGATAYEASGSFTFTAWLFERIVILRAIGTPADCVSLALSGALFSWSKPVLKPKSKDPKAKRFKVEKVKKVKDPHLPMRPPTAFFLFLKAFKEANLDSKDVKRVGKEAGEKWKSMIDEEKKPYLDKVVELKAEYEKAMESYNTAEDEEVWFSCF